MAPNAYLQVMNKSVWAVLAGLLVTIVVTTVVDAILHALKVRCQFVPIHDADLLRC